MHDGEARRPESGQIRAVSNFPDETSGFGSMPLSNIWGFPSKVMNYDQTLDAMVAKLQEGGANVSVGENRITVSASDSIRSVNVRTAPYPAFPTDMQAQMMALCSIADGESVITVS